jgi:hypothetical protein
MKRQNLTPWLTFCEQIGFKFLLLRGSNHNWRPKSRDFSSHIKEVQIGEINEDMNT